MESKDKISLRVDPEQDDNGLPIITKKFLKDLCEAHELYNTPSLNDQLFVHHKGFYKIENLDEYYNLKVLYLDHNLITKIENLHMMKNLKGLYLQNNVIEKIENLNELTNLVTLNLSHNKITKIEGLEALTNLETLDLSYNYLRNSSAIQGMTECPSLTNINLSFNETEYSDDILPIFASMPNLRCLYLKENTLKREFVNYRKVMVGSLLSLTFLDERPVSEEEKRLAIAFKIGGAEGENLERENMYNEKKERERLDKLENKERDERARLRKKMELERIEREALAEKEDLLKNRAELLKKKPQGYESKLKLIEFQLEKVNKALGVDHPSNEKGRQLNAIEGGHNENKENEPNDQVHNELEDLE